MFHKNLIFIFRLTTRRFLIPMLQVEALVCIGCQNACVHSMSLEIAFCKSQKRCNMAGAAICLGDPEFPDKAAGDLRVPQPS